MYAFIAGHTNDLHTETGHTVSDTKKNNKKSDFVTGQPQECALGNHGFLKTAIELYVIKTWPILYSIGLV